MILPAGSKIYRVRCVLGRSVLPTLTVLTNSADEADKATLMYWADQEGYAGEEITILSMSEIDPETL
jgi:hypothetical protein